MPDSAGLPLNPLSPGPTMGLPDPAGRRIGLFGGSFNPPHPGHLAVAGEAIRRLDLDQIWFLVSLQNPLKNANETEDFWVRVDQAKALVQTAARRFRIIDIESKLKTRWTAQTLDQLEPVLNRGRFVWIMGADSFAGLHHWTEWRALPAALPLAVFARPGWCLKALSSPAARTLAPWRAPETMARRLADLAPPAWCFVTMPLRPESSTVIRRGRGAEQAVAALSPAHA